MSNGAEVTMKYLGILFIIIGFVALVVSIVTGLSGTLLLAITARAYLIFSGVCLLFAIAFLLLALLQKS